MNRESNSYIFTFSSIMVLIVASALAITATLLKPKQMENVRKEKMQNILSTVGVEINREKAEEKFNIYIVEQLAIDSEGVLNDDVNAFEVDLSKELKKEVTDQVYPLFKADIEGAIYYIIPLRGSGLWDAIWGYIALKEDLNTIKGVVFDHKGETAGLGAEITQEWFQNRFIDEIIFDEENNLKGITVLKGNKDPNNKDKKDFEVDAISGATITGNGVSEMIKERLEHYLPYFKIIKEQELN